MIGHAARSVSGSKHRPGTFIPGPFRCAATQDARKCRRRVRARSPVEALAQALFGRLCRRALPGKVTMQFLRSRREARAHRDDLALQPAPLVSRISSTMPMRFDSHSSVVRSALSLLTDGIRYYASVVIDEALDTAAFPASLLA